MTRKRMAHHSARPQLAAAAATAAAVASVTAPRVGAAVAVAAATAHIRHAAAGGRGVASLPRGSGDNGEENHQPDDQSEAHYEWNQHGQIVARPYCGGVTPLTRYPQGTCGHRR